MLAEFQCQSFSGMCRQWERLLCAVCFAGQKVLVTLFGYDLKRASSFMKSTGFTVDIFFIIHNLEPTGKGFSLCCHGLESNHTGFPGDEFSSFWKKCNAHEIVLC